MKRILIIIALLMILNPVKASWDALKTDQFTIFYEPAYKARALRALSDLEYYKNIPEGIVGNKCDNMVIVFDDNGQYTNAFANPVYYNMHIMNYETSDSGWLSLAAIHEYTHMIHMTKAGGIPGVISAVIGNLGSTMLFAPNWTFEAITVYNESKLSKYMGRLNDGAFDTYIKICSAANEFPSLMKATYEPLEFPYGNTHYLLGSEFWNYLAITYGEDKFKKFYDSYSVSLASYLSPAFPWAGIDRTFDEVYGDTTLELWDKWQAYEMERAKGFEQEGERVTFHGDNASWPIIRGEKLYYARQTVEKTGAFEAKSYNAIIEMDVKTGIKKKTACTTSGYNHPFRFAGNKMYYSVSDIKPGYANKSSLSYGVFSVIYERDLETGEEREVLSDDIRAFFTPYAGKIIYAKDDPYSIGSELYEYNLDTKENRLLFDSDYLVLALDGNAETMIAEAKVEGKNAALYLVDRGKKSFTVIADTPYYEEMPELYGNRLFYRANYGKVYSAYCYDLNTKKFFRLTENGSSGTPAYYEEGNEIFFAGAHVKGFDIYKKKAEFKPYTLPKDAPDYVLPPLLDEAKLKTGGYLDNLATLYPKARAPYGYYDGDNAVAGLILNGADAIGDFGYTASGQYDFNLNAFQYSANLVSYSFAPAVLYAFSNNINDRSACMLNVGLNVPLYRSLRPGIAGISVWVEHMFFEGFSRRQLAPGAGLSFRWPVFEADMSVSRVMEGAWLGSVNVNRQGTMAAITLRQFFPEGKIELRGRGIYDPDNADDVVSKIRGYADNVAGNIGSSWTLDVSRALWKIRAGLWNPVNVYIEDLCGKVFFDCAFADNTQFSYGLELHLETKWFGLVPGLIGYRAGLNRELTFFHGPVISVMGMSF